MKSVFFFGASLFYGLDGIVSRLFSSPVFWLETGCVDVRFRSLIDVVIFMIWMVVLERCVVGCESTVANASSMWTWSYISSLVTVRSFISWWAVCICVRKERWSSGKYYLVAPSCQRLNLVPQTSHLTPHTQSCSARRSDSIVNLSRHVSYMWDTDAASGCGYGSFDWLFGLYWSRWWRDNDSPRRWRQWRNRGIYWEPGKCSSDWLVLQLTYIATRDIFWPQFWNHCVWTWRRQKRWCWRVTPSASNVFRSHFFLQSS